MNVPIDYKNSININGPSIEGKYGKFDGDLNSKIISKNTPYTLNRLFSGDIKDEIKLNKVNEKLKLFPTENISGSIKGSPTINYFVEYGKTKGYDRPKIKKGKDFYHNPELLIKGIIEGKKNAPPTLKSLFDGDIKGNINLNNKTLKMPEFRIKDDYLDENNKLGIDIHMPNIDINGPKLKTKNNSKIINSMNFNISNKEEKDEINIKGLDRSVNVNGPKLRGMKEKNIEGKIEGLNGNLNIKGSKIDINYSNNINQNVYPPNTLKSLFNGNIGDINSINLKKHKIESPNKNISGIIKGNKEEDINNIYYKKSNNKVQLKRSQRMDFIEYGSTIGYIRPNIKKGIDYVHIPRVEFEKYDSNSPINILNRPYVVNDRKIGSSKFY